MLSHNPVGWFEIPVSDMERAIKFYETVFEFKLERHAMGPLDMAWFPSVEGSIGAGGSLVHFPTAYQPSQSGTLIYFTSPAGDVAVELARVEAAGGKICVEKKLIAEDIGYMGAFTDSEGNNIALHSRKG